LYVYVCMCLCVEREGQVRNRGCAKGERGRVPGVYVVATQLEGPAEWGAEGRKGEGRLRKCGSTSGKR